MTLKTSQTCIVLAGGLGTRLRGVIADRPKCLAPIGDRPFLALLIEKLVASGVTDVVLSLGFMADKIIDMLDTLHVDASIRYVVEEELLGTGGAILNAFKTQGLDEALVVNGDSYLEGDLSGMLPALDRANGELFRMALTRVENRARFGGVDLDATGKVAGFLEKGQTSAGFINAGIYRLCGDALPWANTAAFSLESVVLPELAQRGNLMGIAVEGEFTDIGVPDDYFLFSARHGNR